MEGSLHILLTETVWSAMIGTAAQCTAKNGELGRGVETRMAYRGGMAALGIAFAGAAGAISSLNTLRTPGLRRGDGFLAGWTLFCLGSG